MKKGIAKKLILTGIAATTAITLAACSNTEGGEGSANEEDSNSSSVGTDEKNDAEVQKEGDSKEMPEQEEVDDNNVNEIVSAITTYYTQMFTVGVEGGDEAIIKAQEEMTLAVDGDTTVFESPNPTEAVGKLTEAQQNSLIEVTNKYSEGIRQATNFDEISKPEQATFNMVSLIFRSSVEGLDAEKVGITISPEHVEVDGDKAEVDAQGVIFSMPDSEGTVTSDGGVITISTPLVKTNDGWKVDAAEFISRLMSQPTPAE